MDKDIIHIIDDCKRNDRKAQKQLYQHMFPILHRMCQRFTRDDHTIIQIINDGMLKVYQRMDQYKGSGSFEGWIRRIVFRTLSDHYRSKEGRHRFIELPEYDLPLQSTALQNMQYDDIIHIVNTLPDASKRVFELYAIEGYTHKEIGELLNISIGTSKWHLSNARTIIKKRMNALKIYENYARG